jgi:hypothetical protein
LFLFVWWKVGTVTKEEIVPGLGEAIEARRKQLYNGPLAFAQAAGVTLAGLTPLRRGYRRAYQERLTTPVCRALGWTTDSIDRLLRGEPPVELEPAAEQAITRPSPADDSPEVLALVAEVKGSVAAIQRELTALAERIARLEPQPPDAPGLGRSGLRPVGPQKKQSTGS